jgi:hypothetical protein
MWCPRHGRFRALYLCLFTRIGRDSPRVCLPELEDALEVAKVPDGKTVEGVLTPLPEEGAGSTAIERARSRISAMPDQW